MNASRAGRIALLLIGSVASALARADVADAFPAHEDAMRADELTVGVQLGRDARHFDLLDDVGRSLGLAAGLRIVPIVAANDVQAVYDLLYLDGADLAIVRSDAIEHVRREAGLGGLRRLVRSVSRLDGHRIAVVAHESVPDLDALDGRTVAFGRPGSGELVTGTLLFDALGIDVEKVEGDGARALERVRSGELAAMVMLIDAPDPFGHGPDGRVEGAHVLALPRDGDLAALYHRAILGEADLPGLLFDDRRVPTWSVDVNLVAYAWAPEHARASRVERFVEALVDRAEELGDDASEPEWRNVELRPDTPNLDGSPLVARALERRAATLVRLRERERPADIPETLARVPRVRTVGDGKTVDPLGDGAGAGGPGGLFGELEALLAPPAAAPSPAERRRAARGDP